MYRLRQPVNTQTRVPKPREYAILGRNEKFQDNTVYPLRKPLVDQSANIQSRRHKHDNHSCGIQTELDQAPYVSFDSQYGREIVPARNRIGAQSEYQDKFLWKQPLGDLISDQMLVEDAKVRDRRSDPTLPLSVIDPSEKLLQEKPPMVIPPPPSNVAHANVNRSSAPPITRLIPSTQLKRDQISEYQARYKPIVDQKKPRTRKAFEAEQAEERRQKEIEKAEHAHTDDEGANVNGNLDRRPTHGNLRRWKSEYQTTYKPFWRFDYKNGKWYKDTTVEESGFNPNLFWYKELVSTRQRANEYRSNAEADHFNRDHMLQLQTGAGGNRAFLAWDTNDNDDTDSVISVDQNLQHERQKQQKKQFVENIQSKIHYQEKPDVEKVERVAQTDHQVDRVVYLDEPVPKIPNIATKALVRNLNSSSVQEHMVWDTESTCSQRTNSDLDFKSNTARDLQRKHYTTNQTNKQQTGTFEIDSLSPSTTINRAAGRPNRDTHMADKRPSTNFQLDFNSAPKPSLFQNHLNHLNDRFQPKYSRDDDVLSVNSARSLSSSCSLASQTLERAQQNMNKYWGNHSPSSVGSAKKPCCSAKQ